MNRLRELRAEKGITQQQLAEFLQVDRTSLVKWETGKNFPSVDLLTKLADYFGTTTDYLLGLTDTPEKDNKNAPTASAVDAQVLRIAKKFSRLSAKTQEKLLELLETMPTEGQE